MALKDGSDEWGSDGDDDDDGSGGGGGGAGGTGDPWATSPASLAASSPAWQRASACFLYPWLNPKLNPDPFAFTSSGLWMCTPSNRMCQLMLTMSGAAALLRTADG